ncbi:hypothetical protein BAW75_25130 [Micromonospora chalcea]|nr:hypothetical protein BAW75_25130 [Micromonospora chalcea]
MAAGGRTPPVFSWPTEVTAIAAVPARPNTSRCSGAGSRSTGIRHRVASAISSAISSSASTAHNSHTAHTAAPARTVEVNRSFG